MTSQTIKGYVIVPPLNPWDPPDIIPQLCYHTFSINPAEAWHKRIGPLEDRMDFGIRVQRWFDKGYRVNYCCSKEQQLPSDEGMIPVSSTRI